MNKRCIFECEKCGNEFKSETKLKTHIKKVHVNGNYNCDVCGNQFNETNNIAVHVSKVFFPHISQL